MKTRTILLFLIGIQIPLCFSLTLEAKKGAVVGAVEEARHGRSSSGKQEQRHGSILQRMNPLSIIKGGTSKAGPDTSNDSVKKAQCEERHKGAYFNGECYKYFSDQIAGFQAALDFCKAKGGELWTPNLFDVYLFEKMVHCLPESLGAQGESGWLNVKIDSAIGPILDGNGVDVSNSYVILSDDRDSLQGNNAQPFPHCATWDFSNGALRSKFESCGTDSRDQEVICEYPYVEPVVSQGGGHKLQGLFNKWTS